MTDNPLIRLNRLGQSVWYDNIRRGLIVSGELERMVRAGEIRGITSNPSIFEAAIARTDEYDAALRELAGRMRDPEQAYEILALEDVRAAADILRSVYEETGGLDGLVSLEVAPTLADDPQTTLREAKRLWKSVDRPNLMIKIPGTEACLPAVREAIAAGINVNVTLLFSVERYRGVMDVFVAGLEDRVSAGLPLDRVVSVASFFVSRLDTAVDRMLADIAARDSSRAAQAAILQGQAAIANTRQAYSEFLAFRKGSRFSALAARGANIQRPLWASTSTKNPAYADTCYVEALIAPDSINTMPPATVDAYRDHGDPVFRIGDDPEGVRTLPERLSAFGIRLDDVTVGLETEGVQSFQKAFATMLEAIRIKLSHTG
jgi:transaldolase